MLSDPFPMYRCRACSKTFQTEDTRNGHEVSIHGRKMTSVGTPSWMRRKT